MVQKLTLKEAREKNKLDEFIKEHEKDTHGDAERLESALKSISEQNAKGSASQQRKRNNAGTMLVL